ncbi:MAG: hypothetical protein ACTSW5_09670 [Promethearchaeota archaeon]
MDNSRNPEMELLSDHITENLSKIKLIFEDIQNLFTQDYLEQIFLKYRKKSQIQIVKEIGLNLLKKKIIEKPIECNGVVLTLPLNYWETLSERLIESQKYNSVFHKLKKFHFSILDEKINKELANIPIDIDSSVKEDYKKAYYENPLSFEEYLNINQKGEEKKNIHSEKRSNSSETLRKEFIQALEKRKIVKKKEEQTKSFDNYEAYFKMDERELRRAKKNGYVRRKYKKKSRKEKYQK